MRIKLSKIKELENALYPNNIKVGKVYEGEFSHTPKVGECFFMQYNLSEDKWFRSSIVTEIIDENTFRTENSIYKFETV
jgi:hypothetical protein